LSAKRPISYYTAVLLFVATSKMINVSLLFVFQLCPTYICFLVLTTSEFPWRLASTLTKLPYPSYCANADGIYLTVFACHTG